MLAEIELNIVQLGGDVLVDPRSRAPALERTALEAPASHDPASIFL